jgi:hypothetical protein
MKTTDYIAESQILEHLHNRQSTRGQFGNSLRFRNIGRGGVQDSDPFEEKTEDQEHPNRIGLFCDAPLGMKY